MYSMKSVTVRLDGLLTITSGGGGSKYSIGLAASRGQGGQECGGDGRPACGRPPFDLLASAGQPGEGTVIGPLMVSRVCKARLCTIAARGLGSKSLSTGRPTAIRFVGRAVRPPGFSGRPISRTD